MDRIRLIFIYISVGLSFIYARGQQIGNYIANGSFEEIYSCSYSPPAVKHWSAIDSLNPFSCVYMAYCNNKVPQNTNTIYQLPRTGNGFVGSTFFNPNIPNNSRRYIKNRLRSTLSAGSTYCVTFFVNITNTSSYGNDGIGIYFGDNTLDSITQLHTPLFYLTPQIRNPQSIPIVDTLGWVPVTGTFVATGTEKYAVIGIFGKDESIKTALISTKWHTLPFTDQCIDDVSCIPLNLNAYAGPNQVIYLGDSAFIGRRPDFAIDSGCIWYKLPNMTTAIDTISGLWVKPAVTTTYVVRQELECSLVKWDTVVVLIDPNLVSIDRLQSISTEISLFPNPTSGNLNVTFSGSISPDIQTFSINNSLGQIVRKPKIELIEHSVDIPTSGLAAGLYQIHFVTRFGTVTKKFIKTVD